MRLPGLWQWPRSLEPRFDYENDYEHEQDNRLTDRDRLPLRVRDHNLGRSAALGAEDGDDVATRFTVATVDHATLAVVLGEGVVRIDVCGVGVVCYFSVV